MEYNKPEYITEYIMKEQTKKSLVSAIWGN